MRTKFIFSAFLLLLIQFVSGQFLEKLKNAAQKSAERAVERKVEDKSRRTTEKAVDKVLNPNESSSSSSSTNSKKKKSKLEEDSGNGIEESGNTVGFKRGSRVIFQDKFEKDALGDFPAKWNTTNGGEVKQLKGFGKFLKVKAGGVVYPELSKRLPENFTLEFDLIYPSDHPYRRMSVAFGGRTAKIDYLLSMSDIIEFNIMSAEIGSSKYEELHYSDESINYTKSKMPHRAPLDKIIKIAFEVNGKRIRMFVDGKKMVDLPTTFKQDYRKYIFFNSIESGWKETKDAYFYIGNFVLAETGKDERSGVLKDLMEKGSFSTNAILFASGSDKIQAESTSILEEIKTALTDAPDISVKIVGHTDNTGTEKGNLSLSKKRADAVKSRLVSMGISSNRLQTEGKGQSEPLTSNATEDGKAQNRRVELIKL